MQRIEWNKMCDKHEIIPFEMQSKNQEKKETEISSMQQTEKCTKATTHWNKEHGKSERKKEKHTFLYLPEN